MILYIFNGFPPAGNVQDKRLVILFVHNQSSTTVVSPFETTSVFVRFFSFFFVNQPLRGASLLADSQETKLVANLWALEKWGENTVTFVKWFFAQSVRVIVFHYYSSTFSHSAWLLDFLPLAEVLSSCSVAHTVM